MALPYDSLYGNFTSEQNCSKLKHINYILVIYAKHTRHLCYAPRGGYVRLGINKVVMVLNKYVY